MADQKITELTEATSVNGSDLIPVVINPSSTPQNRKLTVDNLIASKKATGEEINTGTEDAKIVTPKAIKDAGLPYTGKASGSDVNTGTEDVKYVTPKAIADSYLGLYTTNSLSRQAIINGNFDVWQRGTSLTLSSSSLQFLADRWYDYHNPDGGTLPTLIRSRQTLTSGELPNSFYFTRLNTNGAGSGFGNNARGAYFQKIEHGTRYLCGEGKKVTVSFYARSSISGKKLGVFLLQEYGTGGSPSSQETINGTNWTLTSSWTKYTHTFETNILSGKTFGTDNNDFLVLGFQYMWGSNYASRVGATGAETYVGAGNIDIAQVQLCAGEVALPFLPKSFEEELKACQRYYVRLPNGGNNYYLYATGYSSSSTSASFIFSLPQVLRTNPTVSYLNLMVNDPGISNRTISSVANYCINNLVWCDFTISSTTAFKVHNLMSNNTTNSYIDFSSEL